MASKRRVAVFCGSNHGADPDFRRGAEAMAEALFRRGLGLVYGGGDVGLMGVIADRMMARGGEVIGVIPQFLVDREVAHHGVTELVLVETMHERKARIYELSDALIALPGGIGTFEELFEALTWNQLDLHRKPCGLLNLKGYYDPLVAQLARAQKEGFVHHDPNDMVRVEVDPETLLDRLLGT